MNAPHDVGYEDQALRPPASIEAESSVIGGVLLDNASFDHVSDIVSSPELFYFPEHQLIYAAISALIGQGKPADVITVHAYLEGQGNAAKAGGIEYINDLAQYVPSTTNIRRYAEIVRDRAQLRTIISVGQEITRNAWNPRGLPASEVLNQAQQKLFSIGDKGNGQQNFLPLEGLVANYLEQLEERANNPNDVTGIPTGFYDLDRMTSGLQDGDLIVLGGRPSMGKTSLGLNIAENIALGGKPVAVFSMEMSASQLTNRIIGSIGRVDQSKLRTGKLASEDWERVVEAVEKLRNVTLDIDESAGLTINEIRSRARRLARQHDGKLGLIMVDYLQLMSSGREENRANELGEISRGLKQLARELKCPIIALSQLNRGVEQRPDKRPMMSDLRESGAVEQDADLILFIYRDEYYTKEACREPGVAEVIVAKQRNGPTGTIKLAFLSQITKFENLSREWS